MLIIALFVLGLCIGSFLNVCIHRIPRRESVVSGGSRCPACKGAIAFYNNIPLVSYLVLGGRCSRCGAPISVRYPLVELLAGLSFVALYYRVGLGWWFVIYGGFIALLLVISFIDLELRIIPARLTHMGIALGLVVSTLAADNPWWGFKDAAIGAAAGGGVLFVVAWLYRKATGVDGMGMGDVKLLAMIGAFTGWQGVAVSLITASFVGSVVGIALMAYGGRDRRYALPFGPFLSAGAVFYILYGGEFIEWYMGLTGLG